MTYSWDQTATINNLLHRNSFYLGDICDSLEREIKNGFITDDDFKNLKRLVSIVVAKLKIAPKKSKKRNGVIPKEMTINKKNKLPIDKIISTSKKEK